MLAPLVIAVALFALITLGLAWPLVARLNLRPLEKLAATAAASLLGVFLLAWAVYVFALPLGLLWVVPAMALLGLGLRGADFHRLWHDADVRRVASAQVIVSAWCLGWLALTVTYSGGGWVGDWWEHWERATFYLERRPLDFLFLGFERLTARPPLANVVTSAFLHLTVADFAHYQVITSLFGSLAFLPAAVLAHRFGGTGAAAALAVLCMVNPMFVQNATFAWTKLPSALFTLTGFYFFLRRHDADAPRGAGSFSAACLGAALLAHYSAGPYVVILVVGWIFLGPSGLREPAWWRGTFTAAGIGATVLATWFAWAIYAYGARGTFLTNTSVTAQASTLGAQAKVIALNIRDTLIPHFVRGTDYAFIAQRSEWGWWRDWFFQVYQVNLWFAFGSIAGGVLLFLIMREFRRTPPGPRRQFWSGFIVAAPILGVAVHAARDGWGLAHICLQPFVIVGLAFLAARWATIPHGWRVGLVAGLAADFALGIALHFGAQSLLLDVWLTPGTPGAITLASYSESAGMNLHAKQKLQLRFFGDHWTEHSSTILVLLLALLIAALFRAREHAVQNP